MANLRPRLSPVRLILKNAAFILYSLIGVAAILTVVMIIVFQPAPNLAPGWCLIILGSVTLLAAIIGIVGFQNDGCFVFHAIVQACAVFGCCALTVAIFVSRGAILRTLNLRKWPEDRVDGFLKGVRWAYLVTTCLEVAALIMACIAHRYVPVYVYETVQEQEQRRTEELGRIRKDLESQKTRAETSNASALAKKMREKYGKWSGEDFGET